MRLIRRVLSPFVVLAAFYGGARLLHWATADSWSVLESLRTGNPSFDELLMLVVAVLAWACYGWLALGALLTFLAALPGAVGSAFSGLAERVTPAAYRKVAQVALGISVVAGPTIGALPANAAPVDNPAHTAATQMLPSLDRPGTSSTMVPGAAVLQGLDRPTGNWTGGVSSQLPMPDRPVSQQTGGGRLGLPMPDRPVSQAQNKSGGNFFQQQQRQEPRAEQRHRADQPSQHVVKPGDTLWDIAASRLPADAGPAEITREWHRWYEANKQVIGDNPDLILPGQVLQAPPDNH